MRTLTDITCQRCGCTTSVTGLDPKEVEEVAAAHSCPDNGRSVLQSVRNRVVPGPGEHGRDSE